MDTSFIVWCLVQVHPCSIAAEELSLFAKLCPVRQARKDSLIVGAPKVIGLYSSGARNYTLVSWCGTTKPSKIDEHHR